MAESIGSFGTIEILEHFMTFCTESAVDTVALQGSEGVMYCGVGQTGDLFSATIDEPGGILAVLLDSADNDNIVLRAGPFKPSDGGVVMEARFKISDITTSAMFVGFQETIDATTPVMCAEFATESFAYNSSCGGFAGLQFDADGTTDDWRAVAGDNAIAAFDADSDATRAYNAPVNDKFDVIRVEIDPNRAVRMYLSQDSTAQEEGTLKLVKSDTSSVMADSCMVYAVVMCETRAADSDLTLEVDYIYARGQRDWTR